MGLCMRCISRWCTTDCGSDSVWRCMNGSGRGWWWDALGRAEHEVARALADQLLTLAQDLQDPAALLLAHRALGTSCFWLGELALAQAQVEQGMALYEAPHHYTLAVSYLLDPGVG